MSGTREPRTGTLAVLALAGALALAGCDQMDDAGAEPSVSTSTATAPATPPPPTDESSGATTDASPTARPTPEGPPFTAPGTPLEQDTAGGALTVVEVRTGRHDGFDRVVYELAGDGLPGWRVEYVDEAVDDPTGEVVDVSGDATLQVFLTGTAYPDDTGHDEFAEDVTADGAVLEVTRPLTFEAMTQSFVGLDQQRPVRVALLEDPVRVVVDVRTD